MSVGRVRAAKPPGRTGGQGRDPTDPTGPLQRSFLGRRRVEGRLSLGYWLGLLGGGDTYCGCNERSSFPKAAAENRTPGAEVALVYNKHPHLSGLGRFL